MSWSKRNISVDLRKSAAKLFFSASPRLRGKKQVLQQVYAEAPEIRTAVSGER